MASATHIPPDPSPPGMEQSLRRGHETRDASLRAIVIFTIVLFAISGIVQLVVWELMRGLEQHNAASDPSPSPFALNHAPPPEPRLQPSLSHPREPREDMNDLRERWQKELNSYARIAGQPDRARIPIKSATDILVQRGLSTAATQPGGGE